MANDQKLTIDEIREMVAHFGDAGADPDQQQRMRVRFNRWQHAHDSATAQRELYALAAALEAEHANVMRYVDLPPYFSEQGQRSLYDAAWLREIATRVRARAERAKIANEAW